ncbi:MAG TPA: hypothetical protein VGX76_05780, partial [Pirellulales bacterium]|nr:hypothetical protein [Pirellulales bacterium]
MILAVEVPETTITSSNSQASGPRPHLGLQSKLWPWILLMPSFVVFNLFGVPRLLDSALGTPRIETISAITWFVPHLALSELTFIAVWTFALAKALADAIAHRL